MKARVHAMVAWVLWTPRRALTVAAAALLTVAFGTTVGVSWMAYQQQLAQWEDAQQAPTPTPTTTTPTRYTATEGLLPTSTVTLPARP